MKSGNPRLLFPRKVGVTVERMPVWAHSNAFSLNAATPEIDHCQRAQRCSDAADSYYSNLAAVHGKRGQSGREVGWIQGIEGKPFRRGNRDLIWKLVAQQLTGELRSLAPRWLR